MRKVEVAREGKNLKFLVDGKVLFVKWDASVVETALKANQLYPKMRDQLMNVLKSKLEDCTPRLEPAEVAGLIKAAKVELGL